MNNINLEPIYYKVENKDSDLYKRANEFLSMEEKLREMIVNAFKAGYNI